MAIKRFTSIERKFARDQNFKQQYVNFMEEYQALGHMTAIDESEQNNFKQQYVNFMEEYQALGHMTAIDESEQNESLYHLPHYAVFKDTSATTKMGVVSSKPDDGLSLNSVLQTGPVIQDDIFSIMLRFRTHLIVSTADITKMYRCI
ncbi:hypothetical protein QE152_g24970 [Popillia japonica]|uniref:Uncharacterized protein n=1 Tax=Popillia japonica TaxID=7064 RepID=A0AAW1K2W6_POPJA